jgi:UDP-N-acetyl-2-amino-2-deoxyglucuronate dehydrogenase
VTERLKFALVGCGRIAERYIGLLKSQSVPDAELVAVCDPLAERRENASRAAGVPAYPRMAEMFAAHGGSIDVACILTPSGQHAENVVEAAAYCRNVIVEKPMALDIRDAREMIAQCDSRGVRLFVVKQNRFNMPVMRARDALDAGRFGKLVMGSVRVRWSRTQAYYDQDAWRGTWAWDGGVFMNQASHHVDLLVWMLGEPLSVWATSRHALAAIEAEDTGVAVIKFASGAIGVIEATTATRPKDLEGSLSIIGSGGSVVVGGFAVNRVETWQFAAPAPGDDDIARFSENPPDVYGYGHRRYLAHVVNAIRTGTQALVEGAEGLKSLLVLNAIYESIAVGSEIQIAGFRPRRGRLGRHLLDRADRPADAAE